MTTAQLAERVKALLAADPRVRLFLQTPKIEPALKKQAMAQAWQEVTKAHENKGQLPGITTGLTGLDELTGGLHRGDLFIVALDLPGRLEAYSRAPIFARVSGYLKGWSVDIGAQVKAGQVIAEIEAPDLDRTAGALAVVFRTLKVGAELEHVLPVPHVAREAQRLDPLEAADVALLVVEEPAALRLRRVHHRRQVLGVHVDLEPAQLEMVRQREASGWPASSGPDRPGT